MNKKYEQVVVQFHKDSFCRIFHFLLTQLVSTVALVLFCLYCLLSLSSRFAWAFYCIPIIFPLQFVMYIFAWKHGDWRSISRRCFLSAIGILLFLPIFVTAYVIVWNPTLSIEWTKTPNCIVTGQFTTGLGSNGEKFTLQYVTINQSFIGLACASNRKTSDSEYKVYDFITRENDCDDDNRRILNEGASAVDEQRVDTNSETYSPFRQSVSKENPRQLASSSCSGYYLSPVKMPNWLCSTIQDSVSRISIDLVPTSIQSSKRSCRYAYYGSEINAVQNGRQVSSKQLIDQNDFVMVNLDEDVYYAEAFFVCLIALFYLPCGLLSTQVVSGAIISRLLLYFKAEDIAAEYIQLEQARIRQVKGLQLQMQPIQESSDCSETTRKQKVIIPEQIVQFLSPKSLLNDRDVYDIYNQTRRRDAQNVEDRSKLVIGDSSVNQLNSMINDHTRSVFLQKERQISKDGRGAARYMDELDVSSNNNNIKNHNRTHQPNNYDNTLIYFRTDDDQEEEASVQQQDSNQHQQNGGDQPLVDDEVEVEDTEQTDRDSSYLKIREIYKKKLNPKYQKQMREKRRIGEEIVNEEIILIKRINEALELRQQQEQARLEELVKQNEIKRIDDEQAERKKQQQEDNHEDEKSQQVLLKEADIEVTIDHTTVRLNQHQHQQQQQQEQQQPQLIMFNEETQNSVESIYK